MISSIYTIIFYESKRYLWSNRVFFLILVSTLPMLLLLTLTAEQIDFQGAIEEIDLESIHSTLLIAYTIFTYLIAILITIVVVSDIIGGENSLELLVLSTNRTLLLLGKLLSTIVIISISQLFSITSFFSILITYNLPIPAVNIIIVTWIVGIIVSIVPLSVALFSSSLTLRLNMSSHTAAYIPIFIFFIIPSIIYISLFEIGGFGIFKKEMLNYTINLPIQGFIIDSIEFGRFFGSDFQFLFGISAILDFTAIILFETTPIN